MGGFKGRTGGRTAGIDQRDRATDGFHPHELQSQNDRRKEKIRV